MSNNGDYSELPGKEREREEHREKKRRPQWKMSGRSVFNLVEIVRKKARGERPIESKKKGLRKR